MSVSSKKSFDPVTLDIIQNALVAIADEMFVAQRKTSMSAIIYEVLDLSTGVLGPGGEVVASGAGTPGFVGVLEKAVTGVIKKFPQDKVKPGDVFITNDPYYGGVTHLNDMVLAAPVFAGGKLVAWVANIAHWNDVGGAVPGSMSSDATEIFQEGVRIPCVNLFTAGEKNQAVFDILEVNSRLPDFLRGDLWAGISGIRVGERRIMELIGKYGAEEYLAAVDDFMELGERRARAALARLPEGSFDIEEEQDNGDIYKATITITKDAFIVDLTNNPPQKGPGNASREGTEIYVELAFKSFADPDGPGNGGFYRPVEIKTKPGTVFHVQEPGALGYYSENGIRLNDLLLRGLAKRFPGSLPAGHFGSICGTVVGGPHPDTGRHYTIVEPQLGGWGGWPGHDGMSGQFSTLHGVTFNCPAEIAEARYGLSVDQLALSNEPGGEGQWRGGKGIELHYRVRRDQNFLSYGYTRARIAPWGVGGGRDGSTNYVEVLRKDGTRSRGSFATNIELNKDDVIRIVTGSGGGFGPPEKRERNAIRRDIRNGYITAEHAADVYGWRE
jgi:N-methylhydantoinase B